MFDYNKRIEVKKEDEVTVDRLIEYLKTLNPKASISVLGDPYFYIHVEEDGSEVVFDDNGLEDEYPIDFSINKYLERNEAKEAKNKKRKKKDINIANGEVSKLTVKSRSKDDINKKARDLYEEKIQAQTDITLGEIGESDQFLKQFTFSLKGPDMLGDSLKGTCGQKEFKEALSSVGTKPSYLEEIISPHLNKIITIATTRSLLVALVIRHKGRLKIIPQTPCNYPTSFSFCINGINFKACEEIIQLPYGTMEITDIFKLSRIAEMAIPDTIDYFMNREEYDSRDDYDAIRVKNSYNLILDNSISKYGPLVPLAIPIKHHNISKLL
jgi:hypothetical protein